MALVLWNGKRKEIEDAKNLKRKIMRYIMCTKVGRIKEAF